MKTKHIFVSLCVFTFIVISGCKKEADKPANSSQTTEDNSPPIGGATAVFKDTVSVKDGEVTITYAKSDACFPSNEIFLLQLLLLVFPQVQNMFGNLVMENL